MGENKDIQTLLKNYNQEHIVNMLDKLDGEKKDKLIRQIEKIDFEQVRRW